MFRLLRNAFLSLFLEKGAREKLAGKRARRKPPAGPADLVGPEMTPERRELIDSAMQVHRDTVRIMDGLDIKQEQYAEAVEKLVASEKEKG